jgi:hypothetical protein
LRPFRELALLALALGACGRDGGAPPPGAGDSVTTGTATASRFEAPDGSYVLELPTRWTGHFRVDSLSTSERMRARPGVLVFSYLPSDSTQRPQALAVIAVYESAAWAAVRAEGGPPPGDSVVARGGRVYVVGLPQSNPFPERSADAVLFGLLQLRPAELASLVLPR